MCPHLPNRLFSWFSNPRKNTIFEPSQNVLLSVFLLIDSYDSQTVDETDHRDTLQSVTPTQNPVLCEKRKKYWRKSVKE
jgi:hypothetical protein